MRVVIRLRRKSTEVVSEESLSLNGSGGVAVAEEPVAIALMADREPSRLEEEFLEVREEPVELAAYLAHDPDPVPTAVLIQEKPATPVALVEPDAKAMPEPAVVTPPAQEETAGKLSKAKEEKVRCPSCNSSDTWRFGRVKGWRLMVAGLRRGQWVTCRGCGKRFLTRFYGAMDNGEDD